MGRRLSDVDQYGGEELVIFGNKLKSGENEKMRGHFHIETNLPVSKVAQVVNGWCRCCVRYSILRFR